ncbi:MAG TPA: ABC transporter ATP-binding protein/permease [Candidatus Ornithoclostridium faecigallinarum]|nr:ABC transporter ATP-binding protein/permease [Candidatus Ornithoclostridium faecigallinarum]
MIDKELLSLLGGNRKYIAYSVIAMIFGLFANTAVTACICYAIGLAADGAAASSYVAPALIAALCIALRFCITKATNEFKNALGAHVKKDLRHRAYDKMLRLGVRSSDSATMAGMTQVGVEGIEQLDLYYSTYLPQFFYSMIAPFILFAICAPIDWRTAVMLIVCVPLIPISIVAVSKYAKRIFAKYWGKYTSMGDVFLDSVQGLKELKIFKADARKHEQINASAEDFRKITMKVLVMQLASTTIMDLVAYGGAGAGIALAVSGVMNGADPIKALFLVLIAVEFFLPLRSLGSAFHVAMNGASAGRKILEILQAKEPEWGDGDIDDTTAQLRGVTFSYDGKRDVLKDVTMSFPRVGMTAIVGESGCGKSTVVNLLSGAYRPSEGEVLAGGKKLSEISRAGWYSHLAIVSYNSYIFNESVRDNFKLARPEVSDEEIYAALEQVRLAEFVKSGGGLDKVIAEDGGNISGGQKQRLALAVALVADKEIYAFDEATSNIDGDSEAIIMDNIRKLSKAKNVIVISHRLANVVPADNIYFMSDGEVKESGTHDELIAKGGEYARLFNAQKALEEGYLDGEDDND